LDKAYHRGGVVVTDARVVSSKAAKAASDHLPLVIDFHLEASAAAAATPAAVPTVSG